MARIHGLSVLIATVVIAGPIYSAEKPEVRLDDTARREFIRRAQVWMPIDTPSLDLRTGPGGEDSFQPNELVTCDYDEKKLSGHSRKFACALSPGHILKVRYGADNEEVRGSTLATRLLWALGFMADRVYPVQVRCRGCSSDPWKKPERVAGERLLTPAVIERPPDGNELIDDEGKPGWKWGELDHVDEAQGGAPRAQRDALKLLAVFMQHTDTKPEQQRMLCLPGGLAAGNRCEKPFLMLHDVGLTFGRANALNLAGKGSVNLERWRTTSVWKDDRACVGNLNKSMTGTLGDPRISESGRLFLANLLVQLSDRQITDLFDVAGVAAVGDWVAAFKQKRGEIVAARCVS